VYWREAILSYVVISNAMGCVKIRFDGARSA